jgi:serine protease Do
MIDPASPRTETNEAQPRQNKRLTSLRSSRLALLGATAAVALTAAYAGNVQWPHGSFALPAHAETSQIMPKADANSAAQPFSFADIVDHVRGAVVSIKVKITDDEQVAEMPRLQPGDPLERFFKRFGEEGSPSERHMHPHSSMAQGSGFIISSDGYVVTNNHVVDHATDVTVVTDEGKSLPAKVVGTDKKTDLALLKISEGSNYPHVEFATAAPRVGDWALAVGNPFGLGGTVTAGIISARGRDIGAGPYDDFLQIDAPVNRGNSGGPTFNAKGEVVGVNTAIYSPSGGSIGIGFAIPSEVAQNVIKSLKEKGTVTRGWIGVQIQPVNGDIAESLGLKVDKGALVADVQKDAPAAEAGIKSGDVILGVNGEHIEGPHELARKIAGMGPEAKADLLIWRGGAEQTVSVKLGTLPNEKEVKNEINNDADRSPLGNFGLTLAPADNVPGAGKDGVVITDLDPEGVAAQKGLKVGDVIIEAGGKTVTKPSEIKKTLADAKKEGRKAVLLRVKTGEGTRFIAFSVNPAS